MIIEKSIAKDVMNAQARGERYTLSKGVGLLGVGIYVYEGNYPLLLNNLKLNKGNMYQDPVILGIEVELRNCLDLLEVDNCNRLGKAFKSIKDKKGIRTEEVINKAAVNYDTVRGLQVGEELIKGSGLHKSIIKVCIRNSECISKFFIPEHS